MTTVVLNNVTNATTINTARNLTVSGNTTAQLLSTPARVWVPSRALGPLTLGNLNVSSLTANALNGSGGATTAPAASLAGNGASGNVSQAAGFEPPHRKTLSKLTHSVAVNIVVGNNGNSAGRVSLSTGGSLGAAGAG